MRLYVKVDRTAFDKNMNGYREAVLGRSNDLKPAFIAMGMYLLSKYFAENFRQQGKIAQDGRPWEKVGLVTAMTRFSGRGAKREQYNSISEAIAAIQSGRYPSMIDKGTLKQSFTANSDGNVLEYYVGNKALVGTRIPYAEKFQTGFTRPPTKLTDKQWLNAQEKFRSGKVAREMAFVLYYWEKNSHQVPARLLMHKGGILPKAINDKVVQIGIMKANAILKKILQGEV